MTQDELTQRGIVLTRTANSIMLTKERYYAYFSMHDQTPERIIDLAVAQGVKEIERMITEYADLLPYLVSARHGIRSA